MERTVEWTVGQFLFWVLVFAVVLTGVVSVRRAGAVLSAHNAALVAARAALGPHQGTVQAGFDLSAWWGIEPGLAPQAVSVRPEAGRRSLRVRIEGAIRALFGNTAPLGAGSYQRLEDFYPGPPDMWE
ncbi:MAG TPA: hypothetical protein G4O00_07295 [Thermoflexia bacterium]|jgi:hypothetical protein|nr:hypothetical protein [Thermoflexia bacterium]